MKKLIGLLAFTVLFILTSDAQNYFDIRLQTQSINCETNEVCYDVQIKGGTDRFWRFAGQNYRLFYNGNLAEFSRVIGKLDEPYSEPEVVQDIQHLDLSEEGNLSFDENISWLNYYIDMNTAHEGQLLSTEFWTTTSTVCFTSEVDLMGDPNLCFEMVWAREDLTFNYATAFVEVSEWVAPNSTNDHVHGSVYHDLNVDNGDEACFDLTCAGAAPTFDAQLTLKSTDTISNVSCYAVELKSSNSRAWTLGDREIGLIFDGSQASFHSVNTALSGSGTVTIGDQLENESIENGPGNISFEDDFSAVSFSMIQDNDEVTIGQSFLEVAEVCLDFSISTGSEECFEMVIARSGMTEEYFGTVINVFSGDEEAEGIDFEDYNKCHVAPCPDLLAPVSNGDIRICEGDELPLISVEESNLTVRWYATPIGGVPLAQGFTFQPTATGIFYAESYDEDENCYSEQRTEVALVSTAIPSLNILSKACLSDQSTYTLRFSTDANAVDADNGVLEKLVGLEWMVSGIPSGQNVQITLTNNVTACERVEDIEAPNCDCQLVSAPISQGDKLACLDNTYPALEVILVQENMTADWYTRIDGGTPLVTDQLSYIPNNVSETGVYTYYVEARSLENGCTSSMRTEITLTVLNPPLYAFVGTSCSEDVQSYTATFYSDALVVSASAGTTTDDGNGVWTVEGIPVGDALDLQITGSTGCTITKEIASPICECDYIEAPICRGEINTCEGIDYEGFVAFVPKNHEIRWYDSETEGILLATGEEFKPSLSGKYYAEAVDTLSGCVSQERAEVELIINPMPDLQVVNSVLCSGETILWTDLVTDLNNTEGSTAVFSNFRDAINNENQIEETSLIIDEVGAFFFRKTTDAGCYDIETIIVIPENCGNDCLAQAGEYEQAEETCFDGELATLSAREVVQSVIPTGYIEGFLISFGDSKEIFDSNSSPDYLVEAPGTYRIHAIVLDPNDMAFDELPDDILTIDDLEEYISLNEICASLDTDGALFEITMCTDVCGAFAGSPIAGDIECLEDGPVILDVELNPLDVIIPDGYQQIFVLTAGPELVIMGAQLELFSVEVPGEYRVHSLVFDPLTLDLSSVEPGVTTAFDIFSLLMEGGGDICASLDLNGAFFNVEECIEECIADAGETIAVADLCIGLSPIEIQAGSSDVIIPDGYLQTFVLTVGENLTISAIQSEPFIITDAGNYRIHSFVFDPLTLDLSSVIPGITTAEEVVSLIIDLEICASLDVEGALFQIDECLEECIAESGNTIPSAPVCFDENPNFLEVDVSDNIVVPEGFVHSFIITEGSDFIIIGLQPEPFEIEGPGSYEVNSFVYDPTTFDINSIILGLSDLFDLTSMFIDGGGDLCGSIDFFGATFEVDACVPECEVVLDDVTYEFPECFDPLIPALVQIEVVDFGNSQIPFDDGFEIIQILAQDETIVAYSGSPFLDNVTEGSYTIHSLIFDPISFPEENIELGVTTITDIAIELIAAGGDICGEIDEDGTPLDVEICMEEEFIDLELTKQISNLNPTSDEEVTFTLEIFNNSENMASGVAVADRLPSGYTLSGNVSDGGVSEASGEGTEILWSGITIPAFSTERLSFTAIVNTPFEGIIYKNIAEVVGANEPDIDSTPNNDDGDQSEDDEDSVMPSVTEPSIDLELVKTASSSTIQPGEMIGYNLNLANRSMTIGTGIQIEDILPVGIDLNSVANISNGGVLVGNRIVWTGIELGFLSSINLSYIAVISDDAPEGAIQNIAQITAADQDDIDSTPNNDDGDQSEDDEDSAIVTIITPFIDLSLTKEVNNPTPSPGDLVSFEITVNNNGVNSATQVTVTDLLPLLGYDLNSISNISPAAQSAGNAIVWTINEIEPNEEVVLGFDIIVNSDGDDYKNIAQVTSANEQDIDSTPNNDDGDQSEDDEDSAMVTVVVNAEIIDLEVDKEVSELSPNIGDIVTYEVLIVNNGPSDATNVILQDVTPDGIDAMDITGPNTHNNGVITWTIPVLPAGENMVFEYSSVVFESPTDNYTNILQVIAADQEDIDSTPDNDDGDQSEDDEANATIFPIISSLIDLELDKSVSNTCAGSSERIIFTLSVFNNSDVIATGVALEDVYSDGFVQIEDISNGGTIDGNTILWSGLSLLPQETISITYSAMMSTNGTEYENIAQITGADQADVDSTPDNDDGDQSEDDEDSIVMSGGNMFDLELEKTVDNSFAQPGDRVRFDITVHNTGCTDATGVAVRDIIPSGYRAIRNITDFGVRDENVIVWEDLSVSAGDSKTVSFTAEVVHFSINCDYVNVAEILEADQNDADSTPGNDDGDQSEDDEDSAEVFAGSMSDLELNMTADRAEVVAGDMITYTINVCNNGPANATNVEIRDYLPDGVELVGDLTYKGQINGQEIVWSGFTFVVGTCLDLVVQAQVMETGQTTTLVNAAEIVLTDQLDPDSSPGNGSGGLASQQDTDPNAGASTDEDDYDTVEVTQFVAASAAQTEAPNNMEVAINTALYLEGAYNAFTGKLNTTLNQLGYLPGQKPASFFAEMTPAGQPYKSAPWNYDGDEGMIYNSRADFNMDYPDEVVDWILISLRTNKTSESTVIRRAALLMSDGSIVMPSDADPIVIDANREYYLVIQHRNHLPIMSAQPLSVKDGSIQFDFRKNESYTGLLGSGQKDVNGSYCVFAANGDQLKEVLSANDINVRDKDLWFENNGLNSAYMNADFDMNGDVNVNDQIMWLLNNGVFSDVPR